MEDYAQPDQCELDQLLTERTWAVNYIQKGIKRLYHIRVWQRFQQNMLPYRGWPCLASYPNTQATQNDDDPTNTTIFVGGLDPNVNDEHLKQVFSQYGQLVHVKIPVGKRCGFVQFADRSCAEEALRTLQGTQFGGQTVRLSWGRSPSNKQPQVEQSQYNGGYYGYGQGYETYGYAPVAQDPSMYYGGYASGYGGYPQAPQQLQSQQPQP